MEVVIVKGGKFAFTIKASQLSRGLRPSKRKPRNSDFLIVCNGVVGRDGALQALDAMSRLSLAITDGFPYPQIFVFTNVTIACGLKTIYEYDLLTSAFVLKYTATLAGGLWCAMDFYDFIYMSNGTVAVTRDAGSKAYTTNVDLPAAHAMCNNNGQAIIGAPNMPRGVSASMVWPALPIELGVEQRGSIATT